MLKSQDSKSFQKSCIQQLNKRQAYNNVNLKNILLVEKSFFEILRKLRENYPLSAGSELGVTAGS